MIQPLLLAVALVVATAAPALAQTTDVAITLSTANQPVRISGPCEHRAFCGPIRLLPNDPSERRIFIARIALQFVDGIVTAAGLRSGQGSYAPLEATHPCPSCQQHYLAVSGPAVPGSTWEADPIAAPFSHGGLAGLLAGGLAFDVVSAAAMRRWSPSTRASVDLNIATSHIVGIQSWVPLLAARRAVDADYAKCVRAVGVVTSSGGEPTGVLLIGQTAPSTSGAIAAPQPTKTCSLFTSLPITMIGNL